MREIIRVSDSAAAEAWLLRTVTALAHEAVAARGSFRMALSGGSSPLPFYRRLAAADFPWKQTQVWMVDERYVPLGNSDHNGTAIKDIFCSHLATVLAPDALHLIDTSKTSSSLAAAAYAAELAGLQGNPWPIFDFILLGMGADGHTASLFPGTQAAEVKDRTALAVTPLTAPHQRISLSLPVLNAARELVFLVTGAAKREMLARVLAQPDPAIPASLVEPSAGRVVFLVDVLSAPPEIPF